MRTKTLLRETSLHEEELKKCVNCGLCQSVCPTFLLKAHEGLTARGKITLLKAIIAGDLKPSGSIADLFDDCLTCYACQAVCPAGVRMELLWTAARQDFAALSSTSWKKRAGFRVSIGKPRFFNMAMRASGLLFGTRVRSHDQFSGKFNLFRGAPLLRSLQDEYAPLSNSLGTVVLFLSCTGNLVTPWLIEDAIRLLNAAGWSVIIPRKQACCGAPALNNADWQTARNLAKRNIRVLCDAGGDYITSIDATCTAAIKNEYARLLRGELEFQDDVRAVAAKTVTMNHLLEISLHRNRLKLKPGPESVTVHDSCHAKNLLEGSDWRKILLSIDGVSVLEMEDSDHCCGFGGSYSVFHREESNKIAAIKMDKAAGSGANKLLVGSPGCMVKLKSVHETGQPDIMHVIEFLAARLFD